MSRLCLKPRPYRENNVQSGALCGGKMAVDTQNCAVQHAWLLKKMVPPATMATVPRARAPPLQLCRQV